MNNDLPIDPPDDERQCRINEAQSRILRQLMTTSYICVRERIEGTWSWQAWVDGDQISSGWMPDFDDACCQARQVMQNAVEDLARTEAEAEEAEREKIGGRDEWCISCDTPLRQTFGFYACEMCGKPMQLTGKTKAP